MNETQMHAEIRLAVGRQQKAEADLKKLKASFDDVSKQLLAFNNDFMPAERERAELAERGMVRLNEQIEELLRENTTLRTAATDRKAARNPSHEAEIAERAGEHVGELLHQLTEFGPGAPLEQGYGGTVLKAAEAIVQLRDKVTNLETASWADAVQGEAAWKERTEVAELALTKAQEDCGDAIRERNEIRQQLNELRKAAGRELDRALDAILLASAHNNWGPAHDLCVQHGRIVPSTPRPKDPCEELRGQVASWRATLEDCNHAIQYLVRSESMCECDHDVGQAPCLDCALRQAAKDIAWLLASDTGKFEAVVLDAAQRIFDNFSSRHTLGDGNILIEAVKQLRGAS